MEVGEYAIDGRTRNRRGENRCDKNTQVKQQREKGEGKSQMLNKYRGKCVSR